MEFFKVQKAIKPIVLDVNRELNALRYDRPAAEPGLIRRKREELRLKAKGLDVANSVFSEVPRGCDGVDNHRE